MLCNVQEMKAAEAKAKVDAEAKAKKAAADAKKQFEGSSAAKSWSHVVRTAQQQACPNPCGPHPHSNLNVLSTGQDPLGQGVDGVCGMRPASHEQAPRFRHFQVPAVLWPHWRPAHKPIEVSE